MSKLIPPLVSTTPPPIGIVDADDNEDDEFGDFTAAADDTTYGCDSYSIPNTPEDTPKKVPHLVTNDLITKTKENEKESIDKDYQDKRKMENGENTYSSNGIKPNVPKLMDNDSELTSAVTNGHLHVHCTNEDEDAVAAFKNGDEINDRSVYQITENFDDIERPPQLLFDDIDADKEEISETPSNFSISFDDNVIDDDESEADDVNIDLPNHETLASEQTCEDLAPKAVTEDFDEEIGIADDVTFNNAENVCQDDKHSSSEFTCVDETNDDFTEFNAFSDEVAIEPTTSEVANNEVDVVETIDDDGAPGTDEFEDFKFTNFVSNEQDGDVQDDFDDFADFSSAPFENAPVSQTQTQIDIESEPISAPLAPSHSETESKVTKVQSLEIPDVDFELDLDDEDANGANADEDDDDFGDFGDYTTITSAATTSNTYVPLMTPDTVYEDAQCIFKLMFESAALPEEPERSDYTYCDFTQTNDIFKQIKDVTDTHALSYQWAKSQVQQGLLKALNIDTRNILYAHGIAMPKFAANLGNTPLEPVKTDILMPTPVGTATMSQSSVSSSSLSATNPSNDASTQSQPIQPSIAGAVSGDVAIPSAQFDWSESGLANPLDSNQTSTLFDLEQLTASLSLPTTASYMNHVDSNAKTNEQTETNIALEDWDLWLQSVSKEEDVKSQTRSSQNSDDFKDFKEPALPKVSNASYNPSTYDTESVNSLQFPELSVDNEEIGVPKNLEESSADDFSDFTSFQTTAPSKQVEPSVAWPSNMIPLRETYIDDVKTDWNFPADTNVSRFSCNSNNSSTGSTGHEKPAEDAGNEPGWLKPTILTPVLPHKDITPPVEDFTDFQDFQVGAANSMPVAKDHKEEAPTATVDMQSSTSNMNAFGGNLLTPTLLQPTVLNQPQMAQQILWPDPGITDDELARFDLYAKKDGKYNNTTSVAPSSAAVRSSSTTNEVSSKPPETKMSGLAGSLMVEKSVVVPANKVILPFNEVLLPPNNQVVISKDLVLPILEGSPRKYAPQRPSLSSVSVPQPHENEDDWSDFISSSQPTMGTSNTQMSPSRARTSTITTTVATATPELSLSIPQLSSIQPSKTPIPVITPRGLMQTKIPTMSPSTPIKSLHLQQTPLHVNPPMDGYQPAIISNQFAAQMNQSTFSEFLHNSHYQTTSIPANVVGKSHARGTPTHQRLNGFHDDNDEWSDFMSSQPVNSDINSLYNTMAGPTGMSGMGMGMNTRMGIDWNRNNGFSADLPNIITNPVHFQNYSSASTASSASSNSKKPNGILNSKKPQNLNVSHLPDLDFAGSKAKVYNHNKK